MRLARVAQPHDAISLVQLHDGVNDLLDLLRGAVKQLPPLHGGQLQLERPAGEGGGRGQHGGQIDGGAGDGAGAVGDAERELLARGERAREGEPVVEDVPGPLGEHGAESEFLRVQEMNGPTLMKKRM